MDSIDKTTNGSTFLKWLLPALLTVSGGAGGYSISERLKDNQLVAINALSVQVAGLSAQLQIVLQDRSAITDINARLARIEGRLRIGDPQQR